MAVLDLTDKSFAATVSNDETPVLVEFWAEWCSTCKQMASVLNTVAEGYADNLVVAKLNVDDNPLAADQYQVRGLPTMILLSKGNVIATRTGAAPKSVIRKWIEDNLSNG